MSENIYDKMLNVMQERGRAVTVHEDAKGRVCLLGAKNVVIYGEAGNGTEDKDWSAAELPELVEVIRSTPGHKLPLCKIDDVAVYEFNDRADEDEVVFNVLRSASTLFEIRHAASIKTEELTSV
jgi:hypothetical protein